MPRKLAHRLKRPKVRTDWSKWNLYNLSRLSVPPAKNKTFFQQKWLAKSLMRGYHGPHVREGQWTRMFDRRLPAVVPMDHRYLAKEDGSEFAAGRGAGREEGALPGTGVGGLRTRAREGGEPAKTPYMHMAFYPMEKRLDMAVWRALFASSAKQARQFVVHGFVKVNGKKIIYPGYLLNPGDMFSVDPDRVMFGTGARKFKKTSPMSTEEREERRQQQALKQAKASAEEQQEEEGYSEAGAATLESEEEREAMSKAPEEHNDAKKAMKSLMVRAKRILEDSKRKLSGKRQQELRAFAQSVRKTLSKHGSAKAAESSEPVEDTVENLETALAEITSKIPTDTLSEPPSRPISTSDPTTSTTSTTQTSPNPQAQDSSKTDEHNARRDAHLLHAALARARVNPIDVRKPYATPWKPREFMSAFAFIPRYLEVNQNICSAVYLRHPVARPGLAEVPTPFHGETVALAFNWYLRRR